MKDAYTIRVNLKGGIVSVGELKSILTVLKTAQISEVSFGLRQQLIFHLPHSRSVYLGFELSKMNRSYEVDTNLRPNIVSSYVAEEVFQKGNWITEGIYKDILDSFDYDPTLKVNISDNSQSFTPFFSGHLNFVSSNEPNFWYCYLRKPKTNEVHVYSKLIFTNEIVHLSKFVENRLIENPALSVSEIFDSIPDMISVPNEKELKLPKFTLPYYEGFNRYGKKTWLGIYQRNEHFTTDFLLELCELALASKIGELCLTPWKSIIVKGISEVDRPYWSAILAKHNINVRHAANELNWQVEDASEDALKLKKQLVENFNKLDIRTFGICFGIKTIPKTEVFASIMVRRRRFKLFNFIPTFFVYDISYTEDFDPNGRIKVYFSRGVQRFNLPEQLRRSVLLYNENYLGKVREKPISESKNTKKSKPETIEVHQCPSCLSVYDSRFGDNLAGIPAGITFENLPNEYVCGVCEEPKSNFKIIIVEDLVKTIV